MVLSGWRKDKSCSTFGVINSDQGWVYRIENLSNADISDFSVYRRVYRNEPTISSISICLYFVFFRRKFSEKSENSLEIPKILRKFRKFSENSENSQKFLKIRRKFWKFAENSLKRRSFYEALISYRIVSYREKNPHIVLISYRIEKKHIATGCPWLVYPANLPLCHSGGELRLRGASSSLCQKDHLEYFTLHDKLLCQIGQG